MSYVKVPMVIYNCSLSLSVGSWRRWTTLAPSLSLFRSRRRLSPCCCSPLNPASTFSSSLSSAGKTQSQVIKCLRRYNSLYDALYCIDWDEDRNAIDPICLKGDPKDTLQKFSRPDDYTYNRTLEAWCTSPRTLLVETHQRMKDELRRDCVILGQLRACPRDDPDYVNCLCESNVKQYHMNIVARYFQEGPEIDPCYGLDSSEELSAAERRSLPRIQSGESRKVIKVTRFCSLSRLASNGPKVLLVHAKLF
ncbi:hypothetical protein M011DRAFT_471594 [Sporormia fimetaria CBS 119925]|uniref:Uncharacterized protein n=1 Tax=Sporormia fimetaria CBS 119925 TaxID=1340428 RepID=A0A6A6UY95_9PLEO|nr:hypothetical protein M011DRAFT_471594 [Sporormia fimetaria CBS 119925]